MKTHLRSLRILALALVLGVTGATSAPAREARAQTPSQSVRTIDVTVDGGYSPARIVVREGERIRLRFTQRDYSPCVAEVVFPTLGIRRTLPVNESVVVELPSLSAGEYAFRCGMSMIRGTLVVTPA